MLSFDSPSIDKATLSTKLSGNKPAIVSSVSFKTHKTKTNFHVFIFWIWLNTNAITKHKFLKEKYRNYNITFKLRFTAPIHINTNFRWHILPVTLPYFTTFKISRIIWWIRQLKWRFDFVQNVTASEIYCFTVSRKRLYILDWVEIWVIARRRWDNNAIWCKCNNTKTPGKSSRMRQPLLKVIFGVLNSRFHYRYQF